MKHVWGDQKEDYVQNRSRKT